MCGCGGGYPMQMGIPIERETHKKYSHKLKFAWWLFNSWWKRAWKLADWGSVDPKSMPKMIKWAFDLINKTPIPGYENATGTDSCYMVGVKMRLVDSE